jgi:hypothetical protein
MEPKVEWANHLWVDWKYRHEMWGKSLYRSLGFVVTLAIVPWVKTGFFEVVVPSNKEFRGVYGFLPLLLFLVTAVQLAFEYTHLMEVEDKLKEVRGGGELTDGYRPRDLGLIQVFFSKRPKGIRPGFSTLFYLAIGILLWTFWFCLLLSDNPHVGYSVGSHRLWH